MDNNIIYLLFYYIYSCYSVMPWLMDISNVIASDCRRCCMDG
ncbi:MULTISPECIES: hypothetical protein [unclassified Rickettsia]